MMLFPVYVQERGRRDRWFIGRTEELPDADFLRCAGTDPGSVVEARKTRVDGETAYLVTVCR
jgi:hypothetical protein